MAHTLPSIRMQQMEGVSVSSYQHEQTRRFVLQLFEDSYSPAAHFSIQNMAEASHLFQKRPGQWISPSEFALISRSGHVCVCVCVSVNAFLTFFFFF